MSTFIRQLKRFGSYEGGLPYVWLVLTALAMVALWNPRLLPMLLAPNDMAIARIWHDLRSHGDHLTGEFVLHARLMPGALYPFVMHLLLYVSPIEVANKILLSLYLIFFPLSVASLARALGRSPWMALGAFALAFNRDWMFGYTGFLLGASATFFAWAALIKLLRDGGDRNLGALCLLSLVAYFAEPMPWLLLVMGSLALSGSAWQRWRNGLRALLALGPSLALALAMYWDEYGDRLFIKSDTWAATYRDLPALVIDFPKRVVDVIPGRLDLWMGLLVALTLLGLVVWRGIFDSNDDAATRRQIPILLLTLLVGYTMFPWELQQPIPVLNCAARIAPMLAVFLLVLPSGPMRGGARLLLVPMLVAAVVMPLRLRSIYREFSRRNYPYLRLTREVPRGARELVMMRGMRLVRDSVDLGSDSAASGAIYWHWPAWPTALATTYSSQIDTTGSAVDYRGNVPEAPLIDLDLKTIHNYEYFLVRAMPFDTLQRHPALRIIDQVADWTLMQRVLDVSEEP